MIYCIYYKLFDDIKICYTKFELNKKLWNFWVWRKARKIKKLKVSGNIIDFTEITSDK